MTDRPAVAILNRDPGCTPWLRASKRVHLVRRSDLAEVGPGSPVLVLALASELGEVAAFVREANGLHRLKGLLVHADVDPAWLGQLLDRAGLRTVHRLLVHREAGPVRRVVEAWKRRSEDVLVADAVALPQALLVVTCGLDRIEAPWSSVAAVPERERGRFEVADDGSYLHWPAADVHLDVESLRALVDPEGRRLARVERLRRARALGDAVAVLRARMGLRQSDMTGLTARQVRRIEAGEVVPRVASLERLAAGHGMTTDAYLDALARAMRGGWGGAAGGAR